MIPAILSLWEIMELFNCRQMCVVVAGLQRLQDLCEEKTRIAAAGGGPHANAERTKEVMAHLLDVHKFCESVGWQYAKEKVSLINIHLKRNSDEADYSSLGADVRNALDVVVSEMWKRKFIQLRSEVAEYANNDLLFGDKVAQMFPDAVEDIREAGNCISVDSGTAAIFHLMRAVEHGIRALCADVGIMRIRKKKTGKPKYIPLAWAQWEPILEKLQERIDKRILQMRPGKRKQSAQQFYYSLLRYIRGFKDEFRNHAMHARVTYTPKQADDCMDHVRRFMSEIAAKV